MWDVLRDSPKKSQNGTWLANWPNLIFSKRGYSATRKKDLPFRQEQIWVDSACLKMEGKEHFKLREKLGCAL